MKEKDQLDFWNDPDELIEIWKSDLKAQIREGMYIGFAFGLLGSFGVYCLLKWLTYY